MTFLSHFFSELWLEWIQDERIISQDLSSLFERAVQDYICKYESTCTCTIKLCFVYTFTQV